MPIPFTCPHCALVTQVDGQYAGQTGPCAGCGKTVTIPWSAPTWTCARCGGGVASGARACARCGLPFQTGGGDVGDDAVLRMLLPVGRSWLAIAAGYAGLFAVLVFPAPIAIVLGILAMRDISRHPEKHGMGRAIFGLVMGALFTLALVVLVVALVVESL